MELPKYVWHIIRQPFVAFGQLSAAIIKINENSAVRNYANRTILNRTIHVMYHETPRPESPSPQRSAAFYSGVMHRSPKKLNLLKFQGNREKQRASELPESPQNWIWYQ